MRNKQRQLTGRAISVKAHKSAQFPFEFGIDHAFRRYQREHSLLKGKFQGEAFRFQDGAHEQSFLNGGFISQKDILDIHKNLDHGKRSGFRLFGGDPFKERSQILVPGGNDNTIFAK